MIDELITARDYPARVELAHEPAPSSRTETPPSLYDDDDDPLANMTPAGRALLGMSAAEFADETRALHEAAHAVTILHYGFAIRRATIDPVDGLSAVVNFWLPRSTSTLDRLVMNRPGFAGGNLV